MNDRWLTPEGDRWQRAERIRCARLLRGHIRTPSNPLGRIHREVCWFCLREKMEEGWSVPDAERVLPLAPAHHPDYSRPFYVAWLCDSHHRKVDHGSLRVPAKAYMDYSSLVNAKGIARLGLRREAKQEAEEVTSPPDEPVPF